MHACIYTYIYIYAHTYIHVFLFRRIFSLPAIVAMAMCAFVDQLGQRCQTRARPSDRNWPVAERRCAFCSQVEEDARRVILLRSWVLLVLPGWMLLMIKTAPNEETNPPALGSRVKKTPGICSCLC